MLPATGRQRVQIEGVTPEIDCGRFPIKRVLGESVHVEADIFADGHDIVAAVILYRPENQDHWLEAPLEPLVNDRWQGEFRVSEVGTYRYTVCAWVDHFASWRRGLGKKIEAQQEVRVDLLIGAQMIESASERATGDARSQLQQWAQTLRDLPPTDFRLIEQTVLSDDLAGLMEQYRDRKFASTYKELSITVDRVKARYSTWYELFPRSCGALGEHGTFKDVEARLPYIAWMGFDVLYLPPIHPIGVTFRKGRNNSTLAQPEDVGVPWGIGSLEGGHKSIHPQLGTLDDFRSLVQKAADQGIEIALDLAYQCSPDHPYAKEHPQWFQHRPDGTIQHAENPPKKYQDIYPIDFESEDWQWLWQELKSIVEYWIEQDIKIFRVDNPHTKAFPFWEWMIKEIKQEFPEVLFLAEAFTRPKVMYRLAKSGFSQSYTYFTWRNSKWELTEYFKELTQPPASDIFRPNVWPNTPDILHAYLQNGGQPAFKIRFILAATLAASYGIYGPAFEVCENRALRPGSEEYLDSEKYQIRHWDLDSAYSIKGLISKVNWIRREHPALQTNNDLQFHQINSEELLCYTKRSDDGQDLMLMVVNLNPFYTQSGWLYLPLEELGLRSHLPYHLHDILNDQYYTWSGSFNYVEVNPQVSPAHIFHIHQS